MYWHDTQSEGIMYTHRKAHGLPTNHGECGQRMCGRAHINCVQAELLWPHTCECVDASAKHLHQIHLCTRHTGTHCNEGRPAHTCVAPFPCVDPRLYRGVLGGESSWHAADLQTA